MGNLTKYHNTLILNSSLISSESNEVCELRDYWSKRNDYDSDLGFNLESVNVAMVCPYVNLNPEWNCSRCGGDFVKSFSNKNTTFYPVKGIKRDPEYLAVSTVIDDDAYIVVRGTVFDKIFNWIRDIEISPREFMFNGTSTQVSKSMGIVLDNWNRSLVTNIVTMMNEKRVNNLIVTGHSLGGAFATMLMAVLLDRLSPAIRA